MVHTLHAPSPLHISEKSLTVSVYSSLALSLLFCGKLSEFANFRWTASPRKKISNIKLDTTEGRGLVTPPPPTPETWNVRIKNCDPFKKDILTINRES